jgi:hypothetical protein
MIAFPPGSPDAPGAQVLRAGAFVALKQSGTALI